jgi:hypothetical protein
MILAVNGFTWSASQGRLLIYSEATSLNASGLGFGSCPATATIDSISLCIIAALLHSLFLLLLIANLLGCYQIPSHIFHQSWVPQVPSRLQCDTMRQQPR